MIEEAIHVVGAVQCTICGALADRIGAIYQCQKNPNHIGDTFVGIFHDSTYPPEGYELEETGIDK